MVWVGVARAALGCAVMGICVLASADRESDHYKTLGISRGCKAEVAQSAFEQKVREINARTDLTATMKQKQRQELIRAWEATTLPSQRALAKRRATWSGARTDLEELVAEELKSKQPSGLRRTEAIALGKLGDVRYQLIALNLVDEWLPFEEDFDKVNTLGMWLYLVEPSHPRFLQEVLKKLAQGDGASREYMKKFLEAAFEKDYVFDTILDWTFRSTELGELGADLMAKFGVAEVGNIRKLLDIWKPELPPMIRARVGTMLSSSVVWDGVKMDAESKTALLKRVLEIFPRELATSDEGARAWLEIFGKAKWPVGFEEDIFARYTSGDPGKRYIAAKILAAGFRSLSERIVLELALRLNDDTMRESAVEVLSKMTTDEIPVHKHRVMSINLNRVLQHLYDGGTAETRAAIVQVWDATGTRPTRSVK